MTVETGPADAEDETSPTLRKFRREFPDAVLISAKEGTNLDGLRHEMVNRLRDRRVEIRLSIPASRASTIALVYRSGHVLARGTDEDRVLLTAQVPRVLADELAPYIVTGETADGN